MLVLRQLTGTIRIITLSTFHLLPFILSLSSLTSKATALIKPVSFFAACDQLGWNQNMKAKKI